jgi:hypothetical protein
MHTIIQTPDFLRDADEVGMTESERLHIVLTLSEAPLMGTPMPGTGGARKVRFPMAGKGKRGSYRTIHYYGGDDVPVFLLLVLKKGERSDLSQAEKNEMKKELQGLADGYRASMREKVRKLKGKRR